MVGAILLGDTAFSGNLKHAIESGRDFWALLKARASIADVLESLA